jgi:hypothetical protein
MYTLYSCVTGRSFHSFRRAYYFFLQDRSDIWRRRQEVVLIHDTPLPLIHSIRTYKTLQHVSHHVAQNYFWCSKPYMFFSNWKNNDNLFYVYQICLSERKVLDLRFSFSPIRFGDIWQIIIINCAHYDTIMMCNILRRKILINSSTKYVCTTSYINTDQ